MNDSFYQKLLMLESFWLSIFTRLKSGDGLVETDLFKSGNGLVETDFMRIKIWKWPC